MRRKCNLHDGSFFDLSLVASDRRAALEVVGRDRDRILQLDELGMFQQALGHAMLFAPAVKRPFGHQFRIAGNTNLFRNSMLVTPRYDADIAVSC